MSTWDSVIGHEWATAMLVSSVEQARIGHAYLITGPDQVGKTTLARAFAQALNCEANDAEQRPCGRCRTCTLIATDRHPDVRLLLPEMSGRGKLTLKIEAVRTLQQDLSLAAYEARYKVAILKRFDTATAGAANAFLKTLEEPPRNVVLLLTAYDADTLLPTIASRCRLIQLRPLPVIQIEQSLRVRWQISSEQASLLAHLADGRLGWAVQAAQDESWLRERAGHLAHLYEALEGNRVVRFNLADKLARKPELLPDVLKTWLSWWRDLALLQYGSSNGAVSLTNVDEYDRLAQLAYLWSERQALTSLKQTNLALWQLERNANTRLVIENLLLIFPYREPNTKRANET